LASAWVVLEAMLPVTARVARARAAIPVLIDMGNSIRLRRAVVVRMPVGRSVFEAGSISSREFGFVVYFFAITNG
jgi:hypothetical protein